MKMLGIWHLGSYVYCCWVFCVSRCMFVCSLDLVIAAPHQMSFFCFLWNGKKVNKNSSYVKWNNSNLVISQSDAIMPSYLETRKKENSVLIIWRTKCFRMHKRNSYTKYDIILVGIYPVYSNLKEVCDAMRILKYNQHAEKVTFSNIYPKS